MNVLWSNVETLSPSIYGRELVPICERRFLDKDVVGRVAAQILSARSAMKWAIAGFGDTVEQNIKDYLLVGRGVPLVEIQARHRPRDFAHRPGRRRSLGPGRWTGPSAQTTPTTPSGRRIATATSRPTKRRKTVARGGGP